MTELFQLKNTSVKRKNVQRVGRGPGSGRGKTSCRGHKGAKSRSGYRHRYGYEGGQGRLFTRLPNRGFTRGRHLRPFYELNLGKFSKFFQDGEIVSLESLQEKKLISKDKFYGLKILANGELEMKPKKVIANAISAAAHEKLQKLNIELELVGKKSAASDKAEKNEPAEKSKKPVSKKTEKVKAAPKTVKKTVKKKAAISKGQDSKKAKNTKKGQA